MADGSDSGDWRLTSQERDLAGATLARKPYRAYSETWTHDHCAFCWTTFVEETSSETSEEDVLTEGYATTDDHPRGADYYWVCPTCFSDFRERFGWRVEGE